MHGALSLSNPPNADGGSVEQPGNGYWGGENLFCTGLVLARGEILRPELYQRIREMTFDFGDIFGIKVRSFDGSNGVKGVLYRFRVRATKWRLASGLAQTVGSRS